MTEPLLKAFSECLPGVTKGRSLFIRTEDRGEREVGTSPVTLSQNRQIREIVVVVTILLILAIQIVVVVILIPTRAEEVVAAG